MSLAAGVAAQNLEGAAVNGNIRASRVVTDKTKRNAAGSSTTSEKTLTKLMPSKNHAARERRSQRRVQGDNLHKKLFDKKKEEDTPTDSITTKDEEKNARRKTQDADSKTPESATSSATKGEELTDEQRELKKTKSGKGGRSGGGDWNGGWGHHSSSPDHWGGSEGGHMDDDGRFGMNDDGWGKPDSGGSGGHHPGHGGNGGSWEPSWGGSHGSGKSGKDNGWGGSGSGKSGKGSGWGGSHGSGSGKSGKGYYPEGEGGHLPGRRCSEGSALVTVTNLSFQQSFSEIFVMTHIEETTKKKPMFIFGNRTNSALAELAQNANAGEMLQRYNHRYGVEQAKVFSEFRKGTTFNEKFLEGGQRAQIKVRTSGYGERLSIATGMPFTNDGAVVLEDARIFDGAEYWLYAIDTGAEGNIQTCWSVAAKKEDFPFQAECASSNNNKADADLNDNTIPGEGFVTMHRGIHDFDADNDLKDLLYFPTCQELELDGSNKGTDRYARYFYETGFDDDYTLCKNPEPTPYVNQNCNPRDDNDFLKTIKNFDDDNRYFDIARTSTDFDDFCDLIKKANDDLKDAFVSLEPWIFDWRNDIAKVKIRCGDGREHDGWGNDGHDRFHGGWSE